MRIRIDSIYIPQVGDKVHRVFTKDKPYSYSCVWTVTATDDNGRFEINSPHGCTDPIRKMCMTTNIFPDYWERCPSDAITGQSLPKPLIKIDFV